MRTGALRRQLQAATAVATAVRAPSAHYCTNARQAPTLNARPNNTITRATYYHLQPPRVADYHSLKARLFTY